MRTALFTNPSLGETSQFIIDAKRMAKRGLYAAEDLVDDTAHRIKKDPWLSVGVTFGVGMGLGVMLGWLVGKLAISNANTRTAS